MGTSTRRESDLIEPSLPAADIGQPDIAGLADLRAESRGDPSVRIAILDGPVDLSHPCFRAAQITSLTTGASGRVSNGPALQHGTHVASLIFGQPEGPVQGIAPGCCGLLVPVFQDDAGGGALACSELDLARGLMQALAQRAHIINVSAGKLVRFGADEAEPLLKEAVQRCVDQGVLIVAAAGNDGCACLQVPAALPSVLAVGAADSEGRPLDTSNWGWAYLEHGVVTAGENLRGAMPLGGTTERTGTSFAAACVSAVAGLLLSIARKRGISATPLDVRHAILETAARCTIPSELDCRRLLGGRLDARSALEFLVREKGTIRVMVNEGGNMLNDNRSMDAPPGDGSGTGTLDTAASNIEPRGPAAGPPSNAVRPAECGCGSSSGGQLSFVYALGEIGFDFGTEARRDSFAQQMDSNPYDDKQGPNPGDPNQLLAYLSGHPWDASSLIWTLVLDGTPMYAIDATFHPYGHVVYERLREYLHGQSQGSIERVSIPGIIAGSKTLMSGQRVPIISPDPRGMYAWSTAVLVKALLNPEGKTSPDPPGTAEDIANFLDRIYYEVRNLGISPQERAINHAATNAFQLRYVYRSAIERKMKLDAIGVERSPFCRSGSDCWDVKLSFFNPQKRLEEARLVYRFTVDVSDIVPVTVGKVRHWHVY